MESALRLDDEVVQAWKEYVLERERVRVAKESGFHKPWTNDRMLQNYRFCNNNREDDTVTQWIKKWIRDPYAHHPNLWLMLALARNINWPPTLLELMEDKKHAWPRDQWDPARCREIMNARKARGEKLYSGAYMLNAQYGKENKKADDKAYFTCYIVMLPFWDQHDDMTTEILQPDRTLAHVSTMLQRGHGWGGFMAGQVIADMKMTPFLSDAPDWWTWAVSGPGSRRGLNLIYGRAVETSWREGDWIKALTDFRAVALKELKAKGKLGNSIAAFLDAQNLQNTLCEFGKYVRGYSRTKYNGGGV